jgi:hypothetical protein
MRRAIATMRIVETDKQNDYAKIGIHLVNPSMKEIQEAKEDAISKGFEVIYIHKSGPSLNDTDKRLLRELNLFNKVFNGFESDF